MKSNLKYILKKELREVFRDKKSLSMMLIIPFMIPLLVLGMSYLFDNQMEVDTENVKIGLAYEVSSEEEKILSQMNISYEEDSEANLEEAFHQHDITLYITKEGRIYDIHFNEDDSLGATSAKIAEEFLNTYKKQLQDNYLYKHDIDPEEVNNIIQIGFKSISNQANYFANYITVYAFLFIIMAITVSATYPATDATAGEKERGTLETLLTFPIKSHDIIIGKLCSVSLTSFITGLLSLALALLSLIFANTHFNLYKDINIVPSMTSITFAFIIIILYSIFISGLCLAIASKSKSFKEAQSALTPLTFLSFFPSMIAFLINTSTSFGLSLIPFLNFTLIFTDVNNGVIDIANIIGMLLSTICCTIIIISLIIKQYTSEKVLFKD